MSSATATKAPPTPEALQRAKATAWDFLTAYTEPDPVPGATLAEYLDAAYAYAYDETHVDLVEGGPTKRHAKATGSQLIRRFFSMLPKERDFFVSIIDLRRPDVEAERREVLKELREACKDRSINAVTVLCLYDRQEGSR